jgi:hypothetical protein
MELLKQIQTEALLACELTYDEAFEIDENKIGDEIDSFYFITFADIFYAKVIKEGSERLR